MSYKKLAKKIRAGYNSLRKDTVSKQYNVTWNNELQTAEIAVENDAGFKAIIIGNVRNKKGARGYMYLFYTNDSTVPFPSTAEIERRLQIVADKRILAEKDVSYHDWPEYGSLEKQREYFSEIVVTAAGNFG